MPLGDAPSGRVGLIAGAGELPVILAEAASKRCDLIVFGVKGLLDPAIAPYAKAVHTFELGAVKTLTDLLKENAVKKVVIAGAVPKKEMYSRSFAMDDTAKGFLNSAPQKGDDHLLKAFALFLKFTCGVSVLDSRLFLKDSLAPKGVLTRRAPDEKEWRDLKLGYRIAKGIGRMDIGQTVVIKNGAVLAVEALEGTNDSIRRGADLGGNEVVVVKTSKPNQDLRFDLPCVGPDTLAVLRSVGSKALGVEAGKTLLLKKEELIRQADGAGMTLVGLS